MTDETAKQQAGTQVDDNHSSQPVIKVTAEDLPLSCPMPGVTLWSQHPRVFIPIKNGEGHCPYCGNHFVLKSS
ncbi:zinc-finger domain-containing protein [Kangiella shandongensis]|uniref:zinc-finger domain-containing protein n=1 Tax=Kangiella shandongensis TaxID=2763258 RepID=UPI001CBDC9C0|nr:zinc-finger domain-containing protein [Kangiella shandongensis]